MRAHPQEYFMTSSRVVTQEPLAVEPVHYVYGSSTPVQRLEINGLIVIGIVAVVGLIGLFALLGSKR